MYVFIMMLIKAVNAETDTTTPHRKLQALYEKNYHNIFSLFVFSIFFMASNASAILFGSDGGAELQGVLDNITVDSDSSIDVTTDALADSIDSYWSITASGGSIATMIIELAGYASGNTFGIYSGDPYVELFAGANEAGDQAVLSIKADGSVYVNL